MTGGKDLGVFKAAAGEMISDVEEIAQLDTTDHADPGWTRSGNVVSQTYGGVSLIAFGSQYTHAGAAGQRTIRLALERDTGAGYAKVDGGVTWGTLTNANGCTRTAPVGWTIVDASAGDDYRLQHAIETGGIESASVDTDSVHLLALQFPAAMDVCLLTEDGGDLDITSTFAAQAWDREIRRDASSFSLSGTDGIQVLATDRYLVVGAHVFENEVQALGSPGNGAIGQQRVRINATSTPLGLHPRVITPGGAANVAATRARCSCLGILDLTVNDVVRIERRFLNKGTSTDKVNVLGGGRCFFGLIRIGDSAAALRLSQSADEIEGLDIGLGADTPFATVWDVEDEKDAGYTHSTVTNPSRVTMPAGKVLTFGRIGINGTAARGGNDLHLSAVLRLDGTTTLGYGRAGGSPNPGGSHNQSDIHVVALDVFSGSAYAELVVDNYGTADDADLSIQGGSDVIASTWMALAIDGWAGDPLTVEMPVASVASTAIAPTVVAANVVAMPVASVAMTAVAPTVALALTVAMPVAVVTLTAIPPTVAMALVVEMPVAIVTMTAVPPTAVLALTVAMPVAVVTSTAIAPTVALALTVPMPAALVTMTAIPPTVTGGLTVAMPVAVVTMTAIPPTVQVSGDTTVAMPVAVVTLTAVAPAVALGTPKGLYATTGRLCRRAWRKAVEKPPLRVLASSIGRRMGTVVELDAINANPPYVTTLLREYDTIKPGGGTTQMNNVNTSGTLDVNGDYVLGSGTYVFSALDAYVAFAEDNGLKIMLDVLWDRLTRGIPGWYVVPILALENGMSEAAFLALTESQQLTFLAAHVWTAQEKTNVQGITSDYVAALVGRYAANPVVYKYLVANEITATDGVGTGDGYWDGFFYRTLGPTWVADKLAQVRALAPGRLTLINDFDVEFPGVKLTGYSSIISALVTAGAPLDRVGFQMHTRLGAAPTAAQWRGVVQGAAALGPDVEMTELDVRLPDDPTSADLAAQGARYEELVDVCASEPGCVEVWTWGITDGYSWVPRAFPGFGHALLYREDMTTEKPAYRGVHAGLAAYAPPAVLQIATHYENTPFTAPATPFARVGLQWDSVEHLARASDAAVLARGRIAAELWGSLHAGEDELVQIVEQVRDAFALVIYEERVRFGSPTLVERRRVGGRAVARMEIPFSIDDTTGVLAPRVLTASIGAGGYDEALDIVRQRLEAEIAAPLGIYVQLPNTPSAPPDNAAWIRASFPPIPAGLDLAGGLELPGIALIQVFVPADTGDGPALDLVDAIDQAFRGANDRGAVFDPPRPGRGSRTGNYWQRNVSFSWSFDAG